MKSLKQLYQEAYKETFTPPHKQYARNQSIDLIKIIAMYGVLAIHSAQFQYIHYFYGCMAIPLFFMVTGYLQLGREKVSITYCPSKITRILRFSLIFLTLVWLFYGFILHSEVISLKSLLLFWFNSFLCRGGYSVFWFLGALIIIYLFLPILNKWYINNFKLFIIFSSSCIFIMTLVFIEYLIHYKYGWFSEQKLPQTLRFYNYFGYFCLGGLIKKGHFKNLGNLPLVCFMLVVNYIFQEWFQAYSDGNHGDCFYCTLPLIILCISIFQFCIKLNIKNSNIIREFSKLFIPIYVLHMLILQITSRWVLFLGLPQLSEKIVNFLVLAIVVTVVSWVLMKFKVFQKFFSI